jgi:hypothetical protein
MPGAGRVLSFRADENATVEADLLRDGRARQAGIR